MRRPLLLLALLSALAAVPAAGQPGGADIVRGRVSDEDGRPVAGAEVEIRDAESGVRRRTRSAVDGTYMLVIADGSGVYELSVTAPGSSHVRLPVVREADEAVLLADVRLVPRSVTLDPVQVQGTPRRPPGRSEAGTTDRAMSSELSERLPLTDLDPATLATLAPGVLPTAGDDVLGGGFSVGGQRSSQNQVTLDGATFASLLAGAGLGGAPGIPLEGVRSTRIVTSTYDVARGQFAGGEVEVATRGGGSRHAGSATYRLRDGLLEANASRTAWAGDLRHHRASAGGGGPLLRDRLFYHVSGTVLLRENQVFLLRPRVPSGFAAAGVHPDSVERFLGILSSRYGIDAAGQSGRASRSGAGATALTRLDWHAPRHSLALRVHASGGEEEGAFARILDARQAGGRITTFRLGQVATLTSRLSSAWVNEIRLGYTHDERSLVPNIELPGARVRVASDDPEGGSAGVRTFGFGGNPILPRGSRERLLELANDLSWLAGGGHRLRVGGLVSRHTFSERTEGNLSGVFSFASLADLEAGRASSFTRSSSNGPSDGASWSAALYVGDAWRMSERLQVVFGVRMEASALLTAPEAVPAADAAFGVPTGTAPAEVHWSPRVGFSWRHNRPGQPLRLLRGGIGEFRGRVPAALHADALRNRGAMGERLLVCVGDAVPVPDFMGFAADPDRIPSSCVGSGGEEIAGRPNVVAFSERFGAPRTWRASLGYQAQLWRLLGGSIEVTIARGVSLYRVQDLNLRPEPGFTLPLEGSRPVFVDPADISPATGRVGFFASRRDSAFAHAFVLRSDAAHTSRQVSLALNGVVPALRLSFQSSYTYSVLRDQSSFSFGGSRHGFGATPTAGDPNRLQWSASDMDRRHSLVVVAGLPLGHGTEVSLIGRSLSGVPFTPRVGEDLNGDGAANDAAFVFDPARTADPGIAAGMEALLVRAPGRVQQCLRRQMGTVAGRNSCRTGWVHAMDVRVGFRSRRVPRLAMTVEAYNVGSGADLLLHGRSRMRGWGQPGQWVDPVLLHTRGFDPAAKAFSYEVNQGFGRPYVHGGADGIPFSVQVSARLSLGPRPRTDPLGGFGDLGGPGMPMGSLLRITMTGAANPGGGEPGAGAVDDLEEPGHGPGPQQLIARLLPDPIAAVLARADSLQLSQEQRAAVREIHDSLTQRNAPIRDEVTRVFVAAWRGEGGAGSPDALFGVVGPRLNEGRANVQAALDAVRAVLTVDQWEALPAHVRDAVSLSSFRMGTQPP